MAAVFNIENRTWIWKQYGRGCSFEKDLMHLFLKDHCVLCDIALSCNNIAVTHYFGKHHIKEIKKWYSKKYGKDFHIPFEPKPLIKPEFTKEICEVCKTSFKSLIEIMQHFEGKKHLKKVNHCFS